MLLLRRGRPGFARTAHADQQLPIGWSGRILGLDSSLK